VPNHKMRFAGIESTSSVSKRRFVKGFNGCGESSIDNN
jgi:hypothetical protein